MESNDTRIARLRERLGAEKVDAVLQAADAVGASYLPGDQNRTFGLIQRVLVHLKNRDHNLGMIFPKTDAQYRPFFDYNDGTGRIFVIEPGDGPGQLAMRDDWFREMDLGQSDITYYEVVPGRQVEIMLAFLEAYAQLLSGAYAAE